MVRTQIQLTEEQAAQLKELAHESNESIAAIIRKALDQFLDKRQPGPRTRHRHLKRLREIPRRCAGRLHRT